MIFKETLDILNKKSALFWGMILFVLLVVEIIATVAIPLWREYFYNGIQAKDWEAFINGIWLYILMMGTFATAQGFKYYTSHRFSLVVRTALTKILELKWKGKIKTKAKYDNPDQRISEDVKLATELSGEIAVEVFISLAIVLGLIVQMWGSWLLFGLAIAYTALASFIAYLYHRPMVDSEKKLQRSEADYRFQLATNSLKEKWSPTKSLFENVQTQYLYLTKVLMGFTIFSRIKSNFMPLVPLLVLVPLYFAGEIKFGEIMKGVAQFDLLVINAAILIILYPRVTKVIASFERIREFYEGLKNE